VSHGYVWYCIDNSCNNCGISRPTNGLCARCLDLPYCGICKRHLPVHCFDGGPRKICQVYLQIVYHVTIMCILQTLQIALLFLPLHVVSSVCHRTVKSDALNIGVQHSATSCPKLTYPSTNSTHLSKL